MFRLSKRLNTTCHDKAAERQVQKPKDGNDGAALRSADDLFDHCAGKVQESEALPSTAAKREHHTGQQCQLQGQRMKVQLRAAQMIRAGHCAGEVQESQAFPSTQPRESTAQGSNVSFRGKG